MANNILYTSVINNINSSNLENSIIKDNAIVILNELNSIWDIWETEIKEKYIKLNYWRKGWKEEYNVYNLFDVIIMKKDWY